MIDKEKGNLVKADRFGYIKRAMHGTEMLSTRAIRYVLKLCHSCPCNHMNVLACYLFAKQRLSELPLNGSLQPKSCLIILYAVSAFHPADGSCELRLVNFLVFLYI